MNGYDAKAPRVLVMMSTYNGERFLEYNYPEDLSGEGSSDCYVHEVRECNW